MSQDLDVGTWVIIRGGCPITYTINSQDEIEFRCGTRWDGFEFVFDQGALREFVRQSTAALGELS